MFGTGDSKKNVGIEDVSDVMEFSESIFGPLLDDVDNAPSFEEKRHKITRLMLAMAMGIAVLKHGYFRDTDTKEFMDQMANVVIGTVNEMRKAEREGRNGSSRSEASAWNKRR